MRLIDADALPIVTRGKNHHRKYVFADITDAPTIDAIPVEWLRNLCAIANMETDDEMFIDWLIQTWQKEQEAR